MARSCPFRLGAAAILVAAASVASRTTSLAVPWIVFTEVHYRPESDDRLEFVEIFNSSAPHAELEGWRLGGEIDYRFSGSVALARGECLVVARDPQALRERHPELERVVGPFSGRLDDDGGRVLLFNPAGAVVAEMRYGRSGRWSSVPDGTGHTLELVHPFLDPTDPDDWRSSPRKGGSPGRVDAREALGIVESIVPAGAIWRFHRGRTEPPADWTAVRFDDSSWESGPGGFGFGDGDDATVIGDMRGSYLALFTRTSFRVAGRQRSGRVVLRLDYDDGFVAHLNGREVARSNMGDAPSPATTTTPATGFHEVGRPVEYDLGPATDLLTDGDNVLAIQVHNENLDSSDLSLIAELERHAARRAERRPQLLVNEVGLEPAAGGGALRVLWVELYNPEEEKVALAGHAIRVSALRGAVSLPLGEEELAPRGHALVRAAAPRALELDHGDEVRVALIDPSGERVVDLFRAEVPAGARSATSLGRFPDGAAGACVFTRSTPGGPNPSAVSRPLVINEIMYHPGDGLPSGEYIEILNPGSDVVQLEGYTLSGGVRFAFGPDHRIPAAGYLVVAADPAALRSIYPALENVVGPFRGRLSNRSEELAVLDRVGNVVDSVRYADRRPWPVWADGAGSSLELVNERLDNDLPAAWAPSDEECRSVWKTFEYTREFAPPRVGAPTHFQLMLLGEGECRVDDVRLVDSSGTALVDDGFDGPGCRWQACGTHDESGVEAQRPGDGVLRIAASGRGNSRQNYVSLELDRPLAVGESYTVSFRARWRRGSPLLLSRTSGQGLAVTHRLPRPSASGTPGARNSRWSGRPPPVVGPIRQRPVAPSSQDRVRMSMRISSVSVVREAAIGYRHESSEQWSEAALTPSAPEGVWSGTVPPLPPGRVEFYVTARDDGGAGTLPAGAPARTALYGIDLAQHPEFPTYTVLVPDRTWREADAWQPLSNRTIDASIVFGNARIVHGAGIRLRGSPWARGRENWKLEFGADTLDGRRSMLFDGQEYRPTNLSERMTFWVLDRLGVAVPRFRYVHLSVPGRERWSGLHEDVERIDRAYLERWFGERPRDPRRADATGGDGILHKIDGHWELPPWPADLVDDPEFERIRQTFVGAELDFPFDDPELYRWNYPPRLGDAGADLEPLAQLLKTLDPARTPDERFVEEIERLANVDQWLRVLAARTAVNDWDSIGVRRGKNGFLYRRPADGLWYLLPWDADKSWSTDRYGFDSIFPSRLPALRRLLSVPSYRQRYMRHLEFVAERLLDPSVLEPVLGEFRFVGESGSSLLRFARRSREVIRSQLERETSLDGDRRDVEQETRTGGSQ